MNKNSFLSTFSDSLTTLEVPKTDPFSSSSLKYKPTFSSTICVEV
jgi:hypothetical protein